MGTRLEFLAVTVGTVLIAHIAQAADTPRNVILFVPDGLRALAVTPETAPTMAAVRDQGVNFANPHSLFPTFTMPNSSGMSTGHELGDTGTFSNTIFTGYPVPQAGGSVTPFIENDAVLGDIDEHFAGNYVDEESIVKAARGKNFSTAVIGKLGPVLIFDHTERTGERTIIVDDATGSPIGIPLSQAMKDALTAAGLPLTAPSRGENGIAGEFRETRYEGRQRRPAGLLHKSRDRRRAADVQGAQCTVRVGAVVARSRRHPAQPGRQPQRGDAGHQRANLARGREERRRQSQSAAGGARSAGPRGDHRHRHCG